MMKRLLVGLIFLTVSVWFGLQIRRDPGYVLFAHGHWSLEMPLWFLIISLIVIIFILHHVLRLVRGAGNLNKRLRNWLSARRLLATRRQMMRGFIDLSEGRWQKAEESLVNSVKRSDIPVLNYLAAARAAHEQGAYERRDDYLREAHQGSRQAEVAVSLTQAQLQLGHKQFEQALATLTHLRSVLPQHVLVLKLLKQVYFELNEWKSIADLLPDLRRYKVLKPAEISQLEVHVYAKLLERAASEGNIEQAHAFWQSLPRHLLTHTSLVMIYAEMLIQKNQGEEAEKLLVSVLKKNWDEKLIYLYGLAQGFDAEKQLAFAEQYLKQHPKNAHLLLSLGRLAIRNKLWGKARSYLEASLGIDANPETYRELGGLLEQLNDKTAAFSCYRKGLQLL